MKKRIVVVGVFITSTICLQITAHEGFPAKESLKGAQKEQCDQRSVKPATHKPLLKQIQEIQNKIPTRHRAEIEVFVSSSFTYLFAVCTYCTACYTKKNYQEGNHCSTISCGLATALSSLVTTIVGGTTLFFVRKAITGPGIDD